MTGAAARAHESSATAGDPRPPSWAGRTRRRTWDPPQQGSPGPCASCPQRNVRAVSGLDETIVTRVDAVLSAFLDERAASLAAVGEELIPVAEAARLLVLDGGKRLRPR